MARLARMIRPWYIQWRVIADPCDTDEVKLLAERLVRLLGATSADMPKPYPKFERSWEIGLRTELGRADWEPAVSKMRELTSRLAASGWSRTCDPGDEYFEMIFNRSEDRRATPSHFQWIRWISATLEK